MNRLTELNQLAQKLSFRALTEFIGESADWTCEAAQTDDVFPWLCLVVLASPDFVVHQKVLFSPASENFFLRRMGLKIASASAADKDLTPLFDFIKEFSNLQAGSLKAVIESNNSDIGMSLPIIMQGFEDLYFRDRADVAESIWKITNSNVSLHIQMSVEILNPQSFEALTLKLPTPQARRKIDYL